jgi:hypothetical protein
MGGTTPLKGLRYLKYLIPIAILVVVGLIFLLRFGPEKRREAEIEKEAVRRVEALKAEPAEPIDMSRADHFVGAETVLSKKDVQIITTTPKALLEDPSFEPRSEIRVVVEEDRVVITTPRELQKNRTIRPDTPILVLKDDGQVIETTPEKLLTDPSITPDTPIKVIEKTEKVIVTTPEELAKTTSTPETPVRILVERGEEALTLAQLLPDEEGIFFVHTVTRDDTQGIWGIIQHGLMEQFLKGIPVSTEADPAKKEILSLDIPKLADEPRENGYSSYFGRILDEKTEDSYVYNYTNGRMGKNPDYISPGQELVISRFSERELVKIYRHFSQTR